MDAESDYYGAPDMAGDGPEKKPTGDETEMEGETALLPKSMFGGKMPDVGQEFMFKVEHVWQDEVEVSYATGEDEEKKPMGKKSEMDTASDSFDQMANPEMKE